MKLGTTREQERDEFIRRYREEYDVPIGPMGWMDQAFLEASLLAHMMFMERVFFGKRGEPWGGFAYDWIMVDEPVATVELNLAVVPRVELDNGDVSLYGTSGDLDPRGYWLPDVV